MSYGDEAIFGQSHRTWSRMNKARRLWHQGGDTHFGHILSQPMNSNTIMSRVVHGGIARTRRWMMIFGLHLNLRSRHESETSTPMGTELVPL